MLYLNKLKTLQPILFLTLINSMILIIWLIWYSHFGFDYTDESFYLAWISHPFDFPLSNTLFGFIYHPLFKIFNENIVLLREINIIITFILAFMLSNLFLNCIYECQSSDRLSRWNIAACISTTSFLIFQLWLPTPSYNSLTLQALLIFSISIFLLEKKNLSNNKLGWILLGVSGWLTFMAKPSSALALSIICIIYLLLTGKFKIRSLLITSVTTSILLIVSALWIDGSIITFVNRIKEGIELIQSLGIQEHQFSGLLRLDHFELGLQAKIIFIIAIISSFASVLYLTSNNRIMSFIGSIFPLVICLISLIINTSFIRVHFNLGNFEGLLIWFVPFVAILLGLYKYKFSFFKQLNYKHLVLSLLLFLIPFVYAFGTSSNYWFQSSHAGIFWIYGGLILFAPLIRDKKSLFLLLPVILTAQLLTIIFLNTAIEFPYRQSQPLYLNNTTLLIKSNRTQLKLSVWDAQYINRFTQLAEKMQFRSATPLIDLTGHSPGVPYLLGAGNLNQPWLAGGFPNSQKYVIKVLRSVPCEQLARAWILIETDSPRKISPKVLLSVGADFDRDYQAVGSIEATLSTTGSKRLVKQELLKPLRTVENAVSACKRATIL